MGARPRKHWIIGHISHVHLCLDELRRIESVMRAIEGDEDTLRVTGERYVASTIDELVGVEHDTIRDLTIHRDGPRMSVSVRRTGVALQAEDSTDLEQQGAIAQIVNILEGAQRSAIFRLLFEPWVAIGGFAVVVGTSIAALGLSPRSMVASLFPVLYVLGSAWLTTAYVMDYKFAAKATLVERGQDAGFFQRNRDDLVLSLISSVVGLITGIVGTLITQAVISP